MWSDEIDDKMKKAADGYNPAYDDKSWDKMELLLDKHLPLKRKRRRFILLLLPLLLVSTGIFYVVLKNDKPVISDEKKSIPGSESVSRKPVQQTDITISPEKTGSKTATYPVERESIKATPGENESGEKKLQRSLVSKQDRRVDRELIFTKAKYGRETKVQENNFAVQKPADQNSLVPAPDKSDITPVSADTSVSAIQKNMVADTKNPTDSGEIKELVSPTNPQKQKKSAASKISLYFSAGPDISSIGFDNPGEWTLQYGMGLSYSLSKQWSIRAGFYAGHKIYSADSTEYHSSYYPPKLERIDANCLVYEIPVNAVYNFPVSKKHNWFIAGGLSSYLMKEETYEYFYNNAWGQPQYYSHTYKNVNTHIFSVINMSGGYQYHFTDRLSLLAEPNVKIPVSGIGSGKVKLNSGGILFSLGFKPFLKKNQP